MRSSKTIELLLGTFRSTEAAHSRRTSAPMPPCVWPFSFGLPSTSIFAEAGCEAWLTRAPSLSTSTGSVLSSVKLGRRPSAAAESDATLQEALRGEPVCGFVCGFEGEVFSAAVAVDCEEEEAVFSGLVEGGFDLLEFVLQVEEVFVQQRADGPVPPDLGAFPREESAEELYLFGTHEVLVLAVPELEERQRDAEAQVAREPHHARLLGWVSCGYPRGRPGRVRAASRRRAT